MDKTIDMLNIEARLKQIHQEENDRHIWTLDKTSALYWLPRVQGVYRMPRTEFVLFDWRDAFRMLDGEAPTHFPWEALADACARIGYPAFIRTDLASAKHNGPSSYLVKSGDQKELRQIVFNTIEDNALKDLDPTALMVRQFLELDAPFRAFRHHPIANEWRVFANEEGALCHHFYWPSEAIEGHFWNKTAEPADWRDALQEMSQDARYPSELDAAAHEAASRCGGTWSVDFAQDKSGRWWLIDMARATHSWHPKDCPNAGLL